MRSVLITGVSSGIGYGLTNEFILRNYYVFGSVRNSSTGDELKKRWGDNFHPLIFDICNIKEIENAETVLKEKLNGGSLTAVINNAGSAKMGPLLYVSSEDFRRQLDSLVVGQLNVIQRFYKHLISQGNSNNGKIFNISSISGQGSNYFFGCYAAGKHALEGLSKTLRDELKIFGIELVVVAPGNIETSIWKKQKKETVEKYKNTEYYNSLLGYVNSLQQGAPSNSMKIDEFCKAFMLIFNTNNHLKRYIIVKGKRARIPFSKNKVRIYEK